MGNHGAKSERSKSVPDGMCSSHLVASIQVFTYRLPVGFDEFRRKGRHNRIAVTAQTHYSTRCGIRTVGVRPVRFSIACQNE